MKVSGCGETTLPATSSTESELITSALGSLGSTCTQFARMATRQQYWPTCSLEEWPPGCSIGQFTPREPLHLPR